MSDVMDKITDFFCTKKGVKRKQVVNNLVVQRQAARRELDKAIEDLTHDRNSKHGHHRGVH